MKMIYFFTPLFYLPCWSNRRAVQHESRFVDSWGVGITNGGVEGELNQALPSFLRNNRTAIANWKHRQISFIFCRLSWILKYLDLFQIFYLLQSCFTAASNFCLFRFLNGWNKIVLNFRFFGPVKIRICIHIQSDLILQSGCFIWNYSTSSSMFPRVISVISYEKYMKLIATNVPPFYDIRYTFTRF